MNNKMPSSVQFVKGVGPKRAELLKKLNINTVKDLLYYFPRDYEDRSNIHLIKDTTPGNYYTIKGTVSNIKLSRIKKGLNILKVTFTDSTGSIIGVWFNQPYLKDKFEYGEKYHIYGEINEDSWRKYNRREINNPVYEKLSKEDMIHTGRVVPIYSLTEGIQQRRMRTIIYKALQDYIPHLNDILPQKIKNKYNFPSLKQCLWGLHFPRSREHYIAAYKRMAYSEFFLFQLLMLEHKKGEISQAGIKHKRNSNLIADFLDQLHFDLTGAQKNVWQEIKENMESKHPMQRLLQGDVGSGKTVIAVLAFIKCVSSGYQGIFMAPTEILAEQHYYRLKNMLKDLEIRVSLLTGSLTPAEKENELLKIKNNQVDIIVGTHALFQDNIEYNQMGLAVIDEQHRFGVEQRHQLKEKGENPDILVMTATPIPRSLALTLYGDLDVSIIDEMPPGRSPVKTYWYTPQNRRKVLEELKDKLNKGRQAYIVCPLIEPSSEIDAISAVEMKEYLEKSHLKNFKLALLHGQLNADEKNKIMSDFHQKKIDVLITTTVIEVGVDVPNATHMVIENAERFGLAQLHQLRGRVGRGQKQSYCYLIGNASTESARQRLEVMTETEDGFIIAEKDLEIRGPGEFFGTRQHGMPDFKVANLLKNQKILKLARRDAQKIINSKKWPDKYPQLKENVNNLDIKL
ncbi:MAG: ATP-dependent DNA helicase RecG [Halanaerobiales bacterium]